jgi:hypothetical protein
LPQSFQRRNSESDEEKEGRIKVEEKLYFFLRSFFMPQVVMMVSPPL